MKKLFMKELMLSASPLTYIFILFALMGMIPGYPIAVGGFFVCLGVFYSFQAARESGDALYTALLPVKKSDVPRAKLLFVSVIQLSSLFISTLVAALRSFLLSNIEPYASNPMLSANFVWLGLLMLIYSAFDLIFVCGFYKNGYRLGLPFIEFSIVAFLLIGIVETLWHFPVLSFLGSCGKDGRAVRFMIFAVCASIYAISATFCAKKIEKSFEKIDL